jgi:hypothetical protein
MGLYESKIWMGSLDNLWKTDPVNILVMGKLINVTAF